MCEALPSYHEALTRPAILEQTSSHSDTSSISSDAPPAFSPSRITLSLEPNSTVIKPIYHEPVHTRALYELTSPLNGKARSIYLAEIPAITRLNKYGQLPKIEKRHHLYKICESQQGGQTHTAIDGRKTRTIQGTILRRSSQGTAFVATNHGNIWGSRGQLIYCARPSMDMVEWMDATGRVVAVDHVSNEPEAPETLQILVPLDRKMLDMLVAVWVARIHQSMRLVEQQRRDIESCAQQGLRRRSSLLIGGRSLLKTLAT